MISEEVCVKNPTGLHARPANVFVKTAARFPCKVNLQKGARTFNGKSIVSVLSACVKCGTQITIVCDGEQVSQQISSDAVIAHFGEDGKVLAIDELREIPVDKQSSQLVMVVNYGTKAHKIIGPDHVCQFGSVTAL